MAYELHLTGSSHLCVPPVCQTEPVWLSVRPPQPELGSDTIRKKKYIYLSNPVVEPLKQCMYIKAQWVRD